MQYVVQDERLISKWTTWILHIGEQDSSRECSKGDASDIIAESGRIAYNINEPAIHFWLMLRVFMKGVFGYDIDAGAGNEFDKEDVG